MEEIKELNNTISSFNRKVFNAYQAADYLNISYDTLLREARLKKISCSKNGASYLFTIEDLEEWLEKTRLEF